MNKLDIEYQNLLRDILENGIEKKDRTGTGTKSVFGRQIKHKMSEGFPLLTTKKMAFKTMVMELRWFLNGDTNIQYLVKNGCNIWNGDSFKAYTKNVVNLDSVEVYHNKWGKVTTNSVTVPYTYKEFVEKIITDNEFARKWGELGPIYGHQWRNWNSEGVDQIKEIIKTLKTNPDSRRMIVNAWNVGELDQMTLPPCHYGFQVYTRELSKNEKHNLVKERKSKMSAITEQDYTTYNVPERAISLMWNQRSVDTFLGLPFNIASYGLLLKMIANEVNMVPDELIGNLGDTHLYLNHIKQAKEQINRSAFYLPKVQIQDGIESTVEDIKLVDYKCHPSIKAPLSN